MEVVITAAAKLDLFQIGEDIRKEAPTRADPFVQTLVDHCATLADMPRRYPLLPRYEKPGLRPILEALPESLKRERAIRQRLLSDPLLVEPSTDGPILGVSLWISAYFSDLSTATLSRNPIVKERASLISALSCAA